MKMKIASVLTGILLATAAFLLAEALTPNRAADPSGSPAKQGSGEVVTNTTETCDPQTVAKAPKGYTCVVKTQSGSVTWSVEAVMSAGNRMFRVVKDLKSGLYISDDMGRHSHESAVKENLCQSLIIRTKEAI